MVKVRPERETATQDRDLAFYEFGGNIEYCFNPDEIDANLIPELRKQFIREAKACPSLREQARRFLLRNWENERQSYVILHYYCVDCMPVNHVFIERRAKWQITIRSNECASGHFYPGFARCISEGTAYGLKRRKATADDSGLKVGESILVFLDANGQEISSL
jgi:hypothetical protein